MGLPVFHTAKRFRSRCINCLLHPSHFLPTSTTQFLHSDTLQPAYHTLCIIHLIPSMADPTNAPAMSPRSRETHDHSWGQSSRPNCQFRHQEQEEDQRIEDLLRRGLPSPVPRNQFRDVYIHGLVKQRWEEQGMWEVSENLLLHDWWKHERPFRTPSVSTSEEEDGIFGPIRMRRRRKILLTAEQRAQRVRHHHASRPIHQFLWQLHKERDKLCSETAPGETTHGETTLVGATLVGAALDGAALGGTAPGEPTHGEFTNDEVADSAPYDINTRAYNNVKARWVRRFIWDDRWGVLPGMTWKHEELPSWELGDASERVQWLQHMRARTAA